MKKLLFLAFSILLFSSCEKDGDKVNSSDCNVKMKNHFKDNLSCSKKDNLYNASHLFKGTYKEKTVYYTVIVCPTCNTMPPQFGYTCDMEKVEFENFNENMKDHTKVYDSCTKKFID